MGDTRTVKFNVPDKSPAEMAAGVDTQDPSAFDDPDPLSDSVYVEINPAPPPVKHRPLSNYAAIDTVNDNKPSHHKISLAAKVANQSPARFFNKENRPGSPYMPELEAFAWACYHLLIPAYVPQSTHAIYDRDNCHRYVGVSSKAIPDFKPLKEDPLKETDITDCILHRGVTIPEMEELDQRKHDDDQHAEEKNKFCNLPDDQPIKQMPIRITVGDLRRYRIAKGHGRSQTASYLNSDDDNHSCQYSKYGHRVDFDMSFWPVLCTFKKSGMLDELVRKRNVDSRFIVHPDDIRNFPILSHASPYYWSTKPTNISNNLVQIFSSNPWSTEENKIYQKFAANPVFNYFKYQTLLKYILFNADTYRQIARMHIRPELTDENKSLIELLTQYIGSRIQLVRETLIGMPEFAEFLDANGSTAFAYICKEIEEANQCYEGKIKKTDLTLTELAKLDSHHHDHLIALANKLNISTQHLSDSAIKDAILKKLLAKKEIYQMQLIDMPSFNCQYTELRQAVKNQTLLTSLRNQSLLNQMRPQASQEAVSMVSSSGPSFK